MLHFYQILHFSSNLLSPDSGRFTFLRATVGLHSGSSLQYNIAIFSTDWIRHQLFWSEDDPPPATRQSPPSLSAILNLFQHKRQKTLVLIYPFSVSTGLGGAGWGGIYPCSVSSLRSSVWPQVPGTTLEWKNPRFLEFYDRLVSIT